MNNKEEQEGQRSCLYTGFPGYSGVNFVTSYVLPALQPSSGTTRRSTSEITSRKKQADVTEDQLPFTARSVANRHSMLCNF